MKINEIRGFVAVAQAGSIQAAADQLHMTQSALSRLIQRLELDLGASLFDRNAKPLVLTRDGHVALDHGQKVLDATKAFADALCPTAAPKGLLRIGSAHALAEVVAERPLDLLRSSFPQLTVQISVGWAASLLEQLRAGLLDAAVVTLLTDGEPKTEWPARCLAKEDVRVVGASHVSLPRRSSLRAMNEFGWAIQPEGCGYRSVLTQALDRIGAGPPRVVIETFGKDLQLSLVARGAAFALLPASQTKAVGAKKKIKVFNVTDFEAVVSTWFVVRPGRLSPALDVLERSLSGLVGA